MKLLIHCICKILIALPRIGDNQRNSKVPSEGISLSLAKYGKMPKVCEMMKWGRRLRTGFGLESRVLHTIICDFE